MNVRGLKLGISNCPVLLPLPPAVGEEFKFLRYDSVDTVFLLLVLEYLKMTILLIE